MEQNEIVLNEFIVSIDKLRAKYFKNGVMELTDSNDYLKSQEYKTELAKLFDFQEMKIGVKWYFMRLENENMDFWEAEKFERFLNNEVAILKYVYINYGLKKLELHKSKLNRLREIYNKRFSIEIEQNDISKQLTTATQKVQLMYELGIFDLLNNIPELKDKPKKIAELVSAFTGIKTDTIRQPYRAILNDKDTSGYNLKNSINETAVNEVYKKIGIERKKR